MGSIVKRDGVRGTTYRARVKIGGRVRFKSFKRRTDARAWVREVERDLGRGINVPTRADLKRTVGDMIDRYLEEVLPTKRLNRDQVNPRRQLEWWKSAIGDIPLTALDSDVIGKARDGLARADTMRGSQRAPSTCNRYVAALSRCCKVAAKTWKWMPANPCRDLDSLPEPRGRTRFLSDVERRSLLAACKVDPCPDIHDVTLLALSTGMRAGEIKGLRWPDVDLVLGRLTLHYTKNEDVRVVPITGPVVARLRERAKVRRLDSDRVFPGHQRGSAYDYRPAFKRVAAAAGLEDVTFHTLRHTAASHLAMSGASLAELAEILGHRTLAMVKRYAHLTDAHTASVLGRMTAGLAE